MIVVLDNYDSFVHNVARYLRELGAEVTVVRSDALAVEEVRSLAPAAVVLSPGPGVPADAGISVPLVRALAAEVPILGICLGHQVVAEAFGGRIVRATEPVHGRSSPIHHRGEDLFRGLPSPFAAGRYHSLVVAPEAPGDGMEVTAWTESGEVMALRHRHLPVRGVQFHPESIMTDHGRTILANFLELAGRSGGVTRAGSAGRAGGEALVRAAG
jgi:para-aminobenzoate synthetase component II